MTGKTGEARLRDLLLLTSMRDSGRISDALIEIDLVDRSAEILLRSGPRLHRVSGLLDLSHHALDRSGRQRFRIPSEFIDQHSRDFVFALSLTSTPALRRTTANSNGNDAFIVRD